MGTNRRLTKTVSFGLDPEDHDVLREAARPLSPGQFARRMAMAAAGIAGPKPGRRPLPKVANADLLRDVLGEMGTWGNNLNQVAHVANIAKQPPVVATIDALRAELEPIKRRLLTALGVFDA